jgi:hypothetical protein
MSTSTHRRRRERHGEPTWRIVRYADDFVILVRGDRHHVEVLREETAQVLAPMGLRLSAAKTQVALVERDAQPFRDLLAVGVAGPNLAWFHAPEHARAGQHQSHSSTTEPICRGPPLADVLG